MPRLPPPCFFGVWYPTATVDAIREGCVDYVAGLLFGIVREFAKSGGAKANNVTPRSWSDSASGAISAGAGG